MVDVVDVVLDGSGIPEKFLGVTLFALVPNTTEFMNAISFAINGNIALRLVLCRISLFTAETYHFVLLNPQYGDWISLCTASLSHPSACDARLHGYLFDRKRFNGSQRIHVRESLISVLFILKG